jgi:hypothetical protein
MDPTMTFCLNMACLARGQTGQRNIGIHSRKDRRFICTQCRKTCAATYGTVFYRLRPSADLVALIITLLAHGCPVQALMVSSRWLAGEVSEQRDMPLIRQLMSGCAPVPSIARLLFCTNGLCFYIRASRETFRDSLRTGVHRRPRLRPWRNVYMAQVMQRCAQRCVVAVEWRIVDGTPARVETLRLRAQGEGVITSAYIERLNATFRERLAALTRRALARRTLMLQQGMSYG